MKQQIQTWINKGFRYAYTLKEKSNLQTAFTYRYVTTSEKSAIQKANSALVKQERVVRIYNLEEELASIAK